jgi:serine/threonine-protein kinase RsbW
VIAVFDQFSVLHGPAAIRLDTLAATREAIRTHARRSGLTDESAVRFVAAVAEIANNTIKHAGCTGQLRVLQDDGVRLIAEVTDTGPGLTHTDRAPPSQSATSGRGLWLARAFADKLTIHSGPEGTVIHLEMLLPAGLTR